MKSIAPGKIIISGEHAVIYGKPSIAMAVNRTVESSLISNLNLSPSRILFELSNYNSRESFTLSELRKLRQKISKNYERFLKGEISVREIISKPFDLMNYVFIRLLDAFEIKLRQGLKICLQSNIPIGCGMGSSAATIVSVLRLFAHYFHLDFPSKKLMAFGLEAERFQHGFLSGIDFHLSVHGGCMLFQDGKMQKRLPIPQKNLYLVQTGIPSCTTGECVVHSKPYFEKSTIGKDFEAVTLAIEKAIEHNDLSSLQENIRSNHELLLAIGVVPETVKAFIKEIKTGGAAAKICGAGAIRGQSGGIVLVAAETPPIAICGKYGYHCTSLKGEERGVHLED